MRMDVIINLVLWAAVAVAIAMLPRSASADELVYIGDTVTFEIGASTRDTTGALLREAAKYKIYEKCANTAEKTYDLAESRTLALKLLAESVCDYTATAYHSRAESLRTGAIRVVSVPQQTPTAPTLRVIILVSGGV